MIRMSPIRLALILLLWPLTGFGGNENGPTVESVGKATTVACGIGVTPGIGQPNNIRTAVGNPLVTQLINDVQGDALWTTNCTPLGANLSGLPTVSPNTNHEFLTANLTAFGQAGIQLVNQYNTYFDSFSAQFGSPQKNINSQLLGSRDFGLFGGYECSDAPHEGVFIGDDAAALAACQTVGTPPNGCPGGNCNTIVGNVTVDFYLVNANAVYPCILPNQELQ